MTRYRPRHPDQKSMTTQIKNECTEILVQIQRGEPHYYTAKTLLKQLASAKVSDPPSSSDVLETVSRATGIPVALMVSPSRLRPVVDARKIAVLLLKEQGYGWSAIGRILSRNHASIIINHQAATHHLKHDEQFRRAYERATAEPSGSATGGSTIHTCGQALHGSRTDADHDTTKAA